MNMTFGALKMIVTNVNAGNKIEIVTSQQEHCKHLGLAVLDLIGFNSEMFQN